jgi:hypothetical protein
VGVRHYRRNSDEQLRRIERAVARGDLDAQRELLHTRRRVGRPGPEDLAPELHPEDVENVVTGQATAFSPNLLRALVEIENKDRVLVYSWFGGTIPRPAGPGLPPVKWSFGGPDLYYRDSEEARDRILGYLDEVEAVYLKRESRQIPALAMAQKSLARAPRDKWVVLETFEGRPWGGEDWKHERNLEFLRPRTHRGAAIVGGRAQRVGDYRYRYAILTAREAWRRIAGEAETRLADTRLRLWRVREAISAASVPGSVRVILWGGHE